MNQFFRKSAIALAALGLASTSYASLITGFFGGLEASYLQGRNGDLTYINVFPVEATDSFSSRAITTSNHNWGWKLIGGLTFCGGEDLTAGYLRFNVNNSASTVPPRVFLSPVTVIPGITQIRWLFPSRWDNISSHVTFNLDDYYAVFGHTVRIADPWNMRFAFGAEYVHLDSDMWARGHIFGSTTVPFLGYTAKSGLRGIGPRVEMGTTYSLPYGLNVFAQGNGALLVSHRNISLNTMNYAQGLLPSYNFRQRFPVVPKAGVRVGVGFAYTYGGGVGGEGVSNISTTTLSLETGWQAETYIHAIERPSWSRASVSTDTADDSNAATQSPNSTYNDHTKVSNYGYQGPFITAILRAGWL